MAKIDPEEKVKELDGWELRGKEIIKRLEFDSFSEALDFVNEIGDIAEDNSNHPRIHLEGDTVKLRLPLSRKDLTEDDFSLAGSIDEI